mgnify:CR=1 FL=1
MKRKLSNQNPRLFIDLNATFNRAFRDRSTKVKRQLRKSLNDPGLINLYGGFVIDEIAERTRSGKDYRGKRFERYSSKSLYSPSYKESFAFKIVKPGANKIDLSLSGAMLSSMESRKRGNQLMIYFDDSEEAAKAHGHITGHDGAIIRNGPRKGRRWPVRDFFGIEKDAQADLLVEAYEVGDFLRTQEADTQELVDVLNLLRDFNLAGV